MRKFLDGNEREEEPIRDAYGDASDNGNDLGDSDDDELDNEGKNELSWGHLMEYEQTHLRKVYTSKMRTLSPRWAKEYDESTLKRDFHEAIGRIADGWNLKRETYFSVG